MDGFLPRQAPTLPELLDRLDPNQRAGVLAPEGLTVVLSGAGTGKTRVLTTRMVRLVLDGVPPGSITAATFTRKAAREMRQRAEGMGVEGVGRVRISTLHSLSAAILRRWFAAAGLASSDFIIADDDEIEAILGAAIDGSDLLGAPVPGEEREHAKERRKLVREAARRISRWKDNGLTEAMVRDPDRDRRPAEVEAFAAVFLTYQDQLRARGMVDMSDLSRLAVLALETSPEALEREAGGISHLLLDEAQDINLIQLRLVRLLASRGAAVTAVGDDDQSLYSFRGSIERLMERLPVLLPEVAARGTTLVRLDTNYRCTDDVLGHANMIVDHNPRDEPKVLRSGRSGAAVGVAAHASDVAEARDTVRRVAALIADGVPPGEIAVLGRTKASLDQHCIAFLKSGIPHAVQAGQAFRDRSEVMDILAYLKLALDPTQELAFVRIAGKPIRGLGPAAVRMVLAHATERGLALHEALTRFTVAEGASAKARTGAQRLAEQLAWLAEAARNAESSETLLLYVLDEVGYLPWALAQTEQPRSLRESVDVLRYLARQQPDLFSFLAEAVLSREEEPSEGAVHIGTLHGSKGLEWDYVFMPAMEEGILPNERALRSAELAEDPDDPWSVEAGGGLAEERRLAHVGMTRARVAAHLSYAGMRMHFGRPKPGRVSRLLREGELPVPPVPRPKAAGNKGGSQGWGQRRRWG